MTAVLAWHFLGQSRTLRYGDPTPVVLGETLRVNGKPVLCARGLHASMRALDALCYAPEASGLVLCRVRVGGTILHGEDKLVGTERTVLGWCEADPILHEFACWSAEAALFGTSHLAEPDPRLLRAIQVKRAWIRGEATDADLDEARAAAWVAARAAARDAARAAAWAAAWAAARDAAWAAAWAAANTKLEAMALDAMGLTEDNR